jgi:hypothetical protein
MSTPPIRAPFFVQTGGYVVGRSWWFSMHGTWPFGQLRIYDDRLILKAFFRTYEFPRESIESLSVTVGPLSVGIRIEHTVEAYPQIIVFWSFNIGELQEHLEAADYRVSHANA